MQPFSDYTLLVFAVAKLSSPFFFHGFYPPQTISSNVLASFGINTTLSNPFSAHFSTTQLRVRQAFLVVKSRSLNPLLVERESLHYSILK